MPSPAVPARTAHPPPFFTIADHPPRSVTRKRKTPACRICMLHRHAPRAQCTRLCTVIIHTGPRFASQVFMLCKCDSLGYTFHMGASQLGLLRRAQPSTTCVEKSLFAFCVCSHVPYIWPSCVLISSSVCCRRHVCRHESVGVGAAELEFRRPYIARSSCA